MEIKKARYIRVSSSTQNNVRQLKEYQDELLFIDVVSGAIPFEQREQGKELLAAIIIGTINQISVASIDRLGRDAFDIQLTLNRFNQYKVNVIVDNLGVQSMVDGEENPIFKMITDVLANVAQLTRNNIKEAQAQGIKIAVAQGKFKGRVKGSVKPDAEVLQTYKNVVRILNLGKNSLREVAKLSDVSLATVQKVKRILEKENVSDM